MKDYIEYGNEYYAGNMIYLQQTGEITMINLITGEQKTLNSSSDRSS